LCHTWLPFPLDARELSVGRGGQLLSLPSEVPMSFDYASIPLEHEYAKENQSSSVDYGCTELFKAILECALVDLRNNQYRDSALS
jgi:hypothetical protein